MADDTEGRLPWLESDNPETVVWDVPHEGKCPSSVARWLMYVPWAHHIWDYHMVSLIHLRPVPGFNDAHIQVDGATHEVIALAVDPKRTPMGLMIEDYKRLKGVNVSQQFIALDDRVARSMVEGCLRTMAQGNLSPCSSDRGQWERALRGEMRH